MSAAPYVPVTKDEVAFVGTGPVPTRPYYDPAYFELEREAIFKRVWLHVGRVDEVDQPGQYIVRPIEAARASVLIVRGADGELRAFHNVCAHRSAQLVPGDGGTARNFQCRYHGWTYGSDGRLRGVPDEGSFFDVDKAECGLAPIALETCAGFIFVNLDRTPRHSLREFLGVWADRIEALDIGASDVFSEYTYEVEANWKVTFDNFQEIYHGRIVHAKSIGAQTFAPENPFGYPTKYSFAEDGLHRSKTLWFNPNYQPGPIEALASRIVATSSPPVSDTMASSTEHFYLFPNVTFLAAQNRCFTQTVWPIDAHHTRSVIRVYWEGPDPSASVRFAREFRTAATLDVHCEDRDIIEASHQGLRSGAFESLHFQIHEVDCRHAYHAVDRHVEEYRSELAGGRPA
ncbi:MAG: aromatic ring-hydroxylating dioxygenase subunit alpha [Ilumatobacteraceae bacterium]